MAQAAGALDHLTEISTQVQAAVVLDGDGTVVASTLDDERAGRLARVALELFRGADEQRAQKLVQLDAAFDTGSVFVVSDGDRMIAATTTPQPTVGLVYYDLKSALRGLGEEEKPKPRARRAPAKRTTTPRKKKDASA